MRSKLGRDRVQEDAHVGGALRSERLSRIAAARAPLSSSRPGNGLRRRGHPQLLAAAIMAALFGDDQAVALQRQDAATERVKVLSY